MSYSQDKKNKRKPAERDFPLLLLFPLVSTLCIIPLITMLRPLNTHLEQFEWYTGPTEYADVFLFYKMIGILVTSLFCLLCLVYIKFIQKKKLCWSFDLLPLGIYCLLALLSAILSQYSFFSFHGIYEQYESIWILLSYGLMAYYSFYAIQQKDTVPRILFCFTIGIAVMAMIGLTQVFRIDFFQTALGQKLITPPGYPGGTLQFNFEPGRPYMTLYNPNYIGFYAAMVLPVILGTILYAKRTWQKILLLFLFFSLSLILFASRSRAGVVAVFLSMLLFLICMHRFLIAKWKITLPILSGFILLLGFGFFLVNKMNHDVLSLKIKDLFSSQIDYNNLKEIQTNDDNLTIIYQTKERNDVNDGLLTAEDHLVIWFDMDEAGNNVITLADGTGSPILCTLNDETSLTIDDPRFPFKIYMVNEEAFNGFMMDIDGFAWFFTNRAYPGDSTFYCLANGSRYMKIARITDHVPYLEDHYNLASSRGYIWARSIPLLKKHFFLGSGPDTFPIAFPNDDLVGIYNSGHFYEIITKPHSMYLQVGVQTGIPSLAALLVFFGFYLFQSARIYIKNDYSDKMSFIGVSVFAGITGYLIVALTNDSCIATSPIFYCLIGLGLGINRLLKPVKKKEKK